MTDKPPVVCVWWEDASAPDGAAWAENRDHKYVPKMCFNVGFLLYDGEDGVIVASAWAEDLVAGKEQIPRGMIHSVTYLEPVKAKRGKR